MERVALHAGGVRNAFLAHLRGTTRGAEAQVLHMTDVYTPVAVDVPHGMALHDAYEHMRRLRAVHLAYLMEDEKQLEELQYGLDPAAIDECMALVHALYDAWRMSAPNVGSGVSPLPPEPTSHPGYSVKVRCE
jgi:hypothetical protein